MPLSKEANRNRMWWTRWIKKRPWYPYASAEQLARVRERLAPELKGEVPPLTGKKPRYMGGMEA